MKSTETNPVDQLTQALFDDMVVPLAQSIRASGRPAYFALAGEPGAASYFETPSVGVMQPSDFEFPGGGDPEGLIDAIAAYWTEQGETGAAALAPRLKQIAQALREEAAESDGSVDILCYTMF